MGFWTTSQFLFVCLLLLLFLSAPDAACRILVPDEVSALFESTYFVDNIEHVNLLKSLSLCNQKNSI